MPTKLLILGDLQRQNILHNVSQENAERGFGTINHLTGSLSEAMKTMRFHRYVLRERAKTLSVHVLFVA